MVWSPGALKENDAGNGYWQMVSPKLEISCSVFGENDLSTPAGWAAARSPPPGTMPGPYGGPIGVAK